MLAWSRMGLWIDSNCVLDCSVVSGQRDSTSVFSSLPPGSRLRSGVCSTRCGCTASHSLECASALPEEVNRIQVFSLEIHRHLEREKTLGIFSMSRHTIALVLTTCQRHSKYLEPQMEFLLINFMSALWRVSQDNQK